MPASNADHIVVAELVGGIGSPKMDIIQVELWDSELGNHNLAIDPNDDYATCTQCVRAFQDVDGQEASKAYYQQSGMLHLEDVDFLQHKFSVGAIADIIHVESTFDEDLHSQPVQDGTCIRLVGKEDWNTL